MTQPMDDLLLPPHEIVAYKGDEPVYFYTADAVREAIKKAVEAERARIIAANAPEIERLNERLRFTAERWEIECKSQVEAEREACATVGKEALRLHPDLGAVVENAILARSTT